MKVLFITEQHHGSKEFGDNIATPILIGSYECTQYGSYENIFLDNGYITPQQLTQQLLDKEYDIACLVYTHGQMLSIEQIRSIVDSGKKLCVVWFDAILFHPYGSGEGSWGKYAELCPQILLDYPRSRVNIDNVLCLETPKDTRIYNNIDNTEDYDVSFVGCVNSRSSRVEYITYLLDNGISIMCGGGLGVNRSNLSLQDYVNIIKRSKISLNITGLVTNGDIIPRRGRIFEITACGKFLLSDFPEAIDGWFVDGSEYVSFTKEDLLYKVYQYLESDDRLKIADNGYNRYINNYSPKHSWKKIFDICKI